MFYYFLWSRIRWKRRKDNGNWWFWMLKFCYFSTFIRILWRVFSFVNMNKQMAFLIKYFVTLDRDNSKLNWLYFKVFVSLEYFAHSKWYLNNSIRMTTSWYWWILMLIVSSIFFFFFEMVELKNFIFHP